jgi:AcrR family transcriptional regulator
MVKSALQKAREAPASTKARILAAAEAVFAARGFEGASTREIAGRAGVNISSLHYHWESKETLYFAVFQNIYDSIQALVRESIAPLLTSGKNGREVAESTMGHLIDFFADHPNVPKLLVRRILDTDEAKVAIEREILVPAWRGFATLMRDLGLRRMSDLESQLFMLSVNSVMLLYLLDSQQFQSLLGGSIRDPQLRLAVRQHLVQLTFRLLDWDT